MDILLKKSLKRFFWARKMPIWQPCLKISTGKHCFGNFRRKHFFFTMFFCLHTMQFQLTLPENLLQNSESFSLQLRDHLLAFSDIFLPIFFFLTVKICFYYSADNFWQENRKLSGQVMKSTEVCKCKNLKNFTRMPQRREKTDNSMKIWENILNG